MEPEEFIERWRGNARKESAASKQHFIELCRVLEVPQPGDPGWPSADYDFEIAVRKPDGGKGFADVWKRGCFVWEYKGDRRSLAAAYAQARDYAAALDNPPLIIVSDMSEIQIHTNFTGTPVVAHTIELAELRGPEARNRLRHAFLDPERLRPDKTPRIVTEEAAASIGALATALRASGHDSRRVAHFLNRLVFCMFAEDIGLLPDYVFAGAMEECARNSRLFVPMVSSLFRAMKDPEGLFGTTPIPWFNGGLFDDDEVLPLGFVQIRDLRAASKLDWSAVEPSIFGTLFEKGLDPARRREMASLFDARAASIETSVTRDLFNSRTDRGVGIHYTDADKIMKIVEPVVLRPLRLEWEATREKIAAARARKAKAKSDAARTKAENAARDLWWAFRERLGRYRVLDPACGSGNFLYLALTHLKDFDRAVMKEGEAMGLPADDQRIAPDAVMGIEINPYAAELARVTIWIGEIQWQLANGFHVSGRRPILGALPNIQCRDALLEPDGSEAKWPDADAIIGNPPFLGGKRLIAELGEDYVARIFTAYKDRVPAEADLVCYWFVRAGEMVRGGRAKRVGLVATNSIRGGANRRALQAATEGLVIYDAWDDEPWVIDGAAVRVSLICFAGAGDSAAGDSRLDGEDVAEIYTDLTARRGTSGVDLTRAQPLAENAGCAFMGDTKGGAFDIPGDLARKWLQMPLNPNGRPNADVLKPWMNGMDVTRRPSDKWIIDFGWTMSEAEAALYEAPFEYVRQHVRPAREKNRREAYSKFWWRHVEPRPGMHAALKRLDRYLATPRVAKHRVFVWVPKAVLTDSRIILFSSGHDFIFGMLQGKYHELWSLRTGGWHGVGNDPQYTPTASFETFPFPEELALNFASKWTNDPRARAIAEAARELNALRETWLNPPDLVERVPEVVPGYPDRILPKGEASARELRKRTLTNLYNQRPAWLEGAHRRLDAAVAAAYGWPADLADDDILKRLLDLNLARAARQ